MVVLKTMKNFKEAGKITENKYKCKKTKVMR